MVLSLKGKKVLSDFAKSRERSRSGRFLPLATKYVYDMSYIRKGSSHDTSANRKWSHVRITQYSKKKLSIADFRKIADRKKPSQFAIPRGNRESFEAFQDLKYSRRQAQREKLSDGEPHLEEYTGKGGGLRDT